MNADNNEEPWDLVVGRVVAPFGLKGEVRVRSESDFPELFQRLHEVRLELPNGNERAAHITQARISPKGITLTLAGVHDRDQAEVLRGAWVKVKESAVPLPEDSYFIHQVLGLQVVTEEGEELGEITKVIRSPANDVYVTPLAMIPALKTVIKEVDLKNGRMVVSLSPEEESEYSM